MPCINSRHRLLTLSYERWSCEPLTLFPISFHQLPFTTINFLVIQHHLIHLYINIKILTILFLSLPLLLPFISQLLQLYLYFHIIQVKTLMLWQYFCLQCVMLRLILKSEKQKSIYRRYLFLFIFINFTAEQVVY